MTLSWEIVSENLMEFFRKPVISRGKFNQRVASYYNLPLSDVKMLRSDLVMRGKITLKGERIYIND